MSDSPQQWYFARDGVRQGPMPVETLRQMLGSGQVHRSDLVWHAGLPQWQPAEQAAELAGSLPPIPTAAIAPPPTPVGYAGPRHGYPGQPAPDIGQDAGMRLLIPVGRSGWAIAAGYCGLIALFPFIGVLFGVLGVIFGFIAINDIKRNPQRHGMGRAIFGMAAGALGTIGWGLAIIAAMAAR